MLPKRSAVVRGLESGDRRPAQKPPTNSLAGLVDGWKRLEMGIVPPCVEWVNQSAGINQERRHPEMSRRTGQAALGSNGTKEGRRWTPKLK